MNENLLYRKMESYFDGTMPEEERQTFISDPDIKMEIDLHEGIEKALAEEDVILLEDMLLEVGKKHSATTDQPNKVAKVVPFFKKYKAMAAGLALLAIAAIVLQIFTRQPADPFTAHFEKYPMYLNTRSGDNIDNDLNSAISAYENNNYQDAWSRFLTISAAEPDNKGALFYAAMSALQIQKLPDAVAGFRAVANHGDSIYAASAEWYLALSYLKSGDRGNAKKVLKTIVSKGGDFKPNAVELLKDLNG